MLRNCEERDFSSRNPEAILRSGETECHCFLFGGGVVVLTHLPVGEKEQEFDVHVPIVASCPMIALGGQLGNIQEKALLITHIIEIQN